MKRLLLVLATLFLFSCEDEKEDFPVPYPSIYTSVAVESTGQIRMFTKQGEVTNRQVVHAFVQQHGDGYLYLNGYRRQTNGNSSSDSLKITSTSAAHVKYSSQNRWINYTLKANGPLLEFIGQDTVLGIGRGGQEFQDRYLYVLAKAFRKYWYAYFETPTFPFPGYAVKVVERIGVQTTPAQLLFPRMNYVLKQHKEIFFPNHYSTPPLPYSLYKVSGISNHQKENPDYAQLAVGDTLVMQDFNFSWERK
ncbi:hypothetical protein [Rufibacter sp. LB8]|uniref:hypothetical protein n=1 Tax=Rufibacter sp. LB8 TaxID=2777781 RepID=UPI00178C7F37|nr:hypothetical protein [Rufibacter sp. LB8]